jgi:hypothetical protein
MQLHSELDGMEAVALNHRGTEAQSFTEKRANAEDYTMNPLLPSGEKGQGMRGFARGSAPESNGVNPHTSLTRALFVGPVRLVPRYSAESPSPPAPSPQGERGASCSFHSLCASEALWLNDAGPAFPGNAA